MTGAAVRQWVAAHPRVVDGGLVLALFVAGVTVQPHEAGVTSHLDAVSVALLGAACGALLVARSRPLAVWAVTLGIGVVATVRDDALSMAALPALAALFAVAVQRPVRIAAAAMACTIGACAALAIAVEGSSPSVASSLAGWSATAAALGVAIRGQRAALQAARERAEQAEATREEEAERRVTDERLRIAHELHDVIAHHVSVINVQSGVARHLLHRRPDQAEAALDAVRGASRTVLTETAELVGLLRSDEEDLPTQPAPGLNRLDDLLRATRQAGLDLTVEVLGDRPARTPSVDLVAYRVVQEAVTNALKHGTGAAQLRIELSPAMVVVDVRNPVAEGTSVERTGDGHGLIGMRERLTTVGGSLSAGPDQRGGFAVHAEIPVSGGA